MNQYPLNKTVDAFDRDHINKLLPFWHSGKGNANFVLCI
jgi:hypothetical protein